MTNVDLSPQRGLRPAIPDLDIWLKAFSRQGPEPLVVHAFQVGVERRQLFLVGLVRQALLARTANERQLTRLERALSGFPDVRVMPSDHMAAARRMQTQRDLQHRVSPWQALLWAIAERTGAVIWSSARHWQPLVAAGCPATTILPSPSSSAAL